MDFRHLIVTCLFSMLRLSFETQKIKENYAILRGKRRFMGMPLVLFRDCGGKGLLRYMAYIEQKDGMELVLLIKSLCDYLVVRVKETA